MLYKRNWQDVLARQRGFWARQLPDQILARIFLPNPHLDDWLATRGRQLPVSSPTPPDPRDVLELWDRRLCVQADLDDDGLPVMIPSEFDEGLYAAVLGRPMGFSFDPESGWFSSMAAPFLHSYDDLPDLRLPADSPWLTELDDRLSFYVHQAAGRFGVCPIVSIEALNFAALARGATQALLDVDDAPEHLRRLMDASIELPLALHQRQARAIGQLQGGTLDGYAALGAWAPGQSINLSVDAYGMCRREVYQDMGFEYTQRMLDAIGGGFLHVHANAHHLLPAVARLHGLHAIWLMDEAPHPFDRLAELQRQAAGVPLITECTRPEFDAALRDHTLPGGVFYIVRGHKEGRVTLLSPGAADAADANRLMDQVRRYRT